MFISYRNCKLNNLILIVIIHFIEIEKIPFNRLLKKRYIMRIIRRTNFKVMYLRQYCFFLNF